MIRKGTEDIANCHVFESDLYLISRATFPAYFIRDESRADLVKSDLDIDGISFEEIPRLAEISAGRVRSLIESGNIEKIREMVPESTYEVIQRRS